MQTKFHVKYCGFDKIFMDKDLIEDKLQMTDQFNERKSTPKSFCSIQQNTSTSWWKWNMRTCEILLANNDKMIKLIDEALN